MSWEYEVTDEFVTIVRNLPNEDLKKAVCECIKKVMNLKDPKKKMGGQRRDGHWAYSCKNTPECICLLICKIDEEKKIVFFLDLERQSNIYQ